MFQNSEARELQREEQAKIDELHAKQVALDEQLSKPPMRLRLEEGRKSDVGTVVLSVLLLLMSGIVIFQHVQKRGEIWKMKLEHEGEVYDLNKNHGLEVTKLQVEQARKLENLKMEHRTEVNELKVEHREEVETL